MRTVIVVESKALWLFSVFWVALRNEPWFPGCDVCILRTRSDMGVARMWGLSQVIKYA